MKRLLTGSSYTKRVRFAADSPQISDKTKNRMKYSHHIRRAVARAVSSRLGLIFMLLVGLSVLTFILYDMLLFPREKSIAGISKKENANVGTVDREEVETENYEDSHRPNIEHSRDEEDQRRNEEKTVGAGETLTQQVETENHDKNVNQLKQDSVQHDNYHVLLQLVNAYPGSKFESNFYNCIKSILSRTSLNLTFHVTSDQKSEEIAESVFKKVSTETKKVIPRRKYYPVDELNKKLYKITKPLQELFSSGPNTYYSHALFFIPVALHKILPEDMSRLIMLDTDLQFRTDIKNLFSIFNEMAPTNIMALAREQQPVYRHIIHMYLNKNPGSKLGGPPPDGSTGFNSGVKLVNLNVMRTSKVYNDLLMNPTKIKRLANKYTFKGHLGDQDFFSLISFENPKLFHILPCSWNRQLCTFWRDNGYRDVFDQYHSCDPPIYVYHGNCDSRIPDET